MAESQIPLKFLDISWGRTQQTICRDHKAVTLIPLCITKKNIEFIVQRLFLQRLNNEAESCYLQKV